MTRPLAAVLPPRVRTGAGVAGAVLLVAALGVEVTNSLVHVELVLAAAAAALLVVAAVARPVSGLRVGLLLATVLALVLTAAAGTRSGDGWLAALLVVPVAALGALALRAAVESARAARALDDERRRARVEGEERERARWARDLHDDTLQELGALQVLLASAQRTADPAAREHALADATGLLAGQLATLRHLVAELRPLALDQLGLVPSLTSLVRRTVEERGLATDVCVELGPDRRLPAAVEVAAYRIVQEALRNVVRHAAASRVAVAVVEEPGRVTVTVRDDGRGVARVPPGVAEGHFGMLGMRERAELVGGTFTVGPDPAGGTRITAVLPLDRPQPPARVSLAQAPAAPAGA